MIKPSFLNSGTTNFQIARLLCERRLLKLTVITCDIQIARLLCSQETFTVILLGGMLRKNYCYSYGFIASNILDNLIADKFFLGIDAISLIAGITCATLDEIPLKRASMKASSEVVAVVNSSKFGICTPYRLCDWEDIQCILTDDRAELSYLEFFKQQGCKVISVLCLKSSGKNWRKSAVQGEFLDGTHTERKDGKNAIIIILLIGQEMPSTE